MNQVTYYSNTMSKPIIDVSLKEILLSIKSGKWKKEIEHLRSLTDEKEQKEYKAKTLPAITVSGVFGDKKADSLKKHSGFIAMDFDGIEDLEEARSLLYGDKYTYCGFVSARGGGLCIVVKIDPLKHGQSFLALEKYYFETYGYQVDTATKNINRLRFISYDPDLYINEKSLKWVKEIKEKKTKNVDVIFKDSDIDFVCKQIKVKSLDLTDNYQTWIELGMALKSHLGDSGLDYFHLISSFHPNYKPDQVVKKWNSFSPSNIGIGSFFYHAKNAGLEIVTPETKHITDVAIYGKKGRRTEKDVIQQLKKIDGIKPEKSKELVAKVFQSNASVDVNDESILEELEKYLKREYDITYNEITLKYELDGRPMNDRDFNTIYLNSKLVIPKVSKDLVITCIDSDRTKKNNPVQEWFKKHYSIKPKGLIYEIADSIKTPTGFKESNDFAYSRDFFRKWIIGAVAMWHGEMSPLMLVLAGSKQNTGKTHFFRYLLPEDLQPYFAEAELSGDKDENLLMCSKIMIMNDEMSNKNNKDIAVMKKLCSTQWFNLRRPYGKFTEDFKRIATLCGTSNDLQLLNDPSGNRRIIPIEVDSIDHERYNKVDKTELWMEAYHAYKNGEDYKLTNDDIKRLAETAIDFEEASPESELLQKYFRVPDGGQDVFVDELTNTEIKSFCELNSRQILSSKKLGMELKRLGFEQNIVKRNGKMMRVYRCVNLQNYQTN